MNDQQIRVLLVEDNPGDARLIEESLADSTQCSFDVETTDRLKSAVHRLSAGGIDAILLDLGLPDSEGQDTFERAKAAASTVPIIVLTGLGDEALAVKMVREGAQDYVAKGDLNGSTLSRAIRYAIERERTEQKIRRFNEELEERVRDRTAELEAANRELEAFSASVSHDLRGPLHRIDGFSNLLEEQFGSVIGSEGKEYLDRIHASVLRMSTIIEDLLKLSRLGRQQLKTEPTRLNEIVATILVDLNSQSQGRQINWIVGDLPLVECDPGLIRQALINLMGNSVKYTRTRPVALIEVGQMLIGQETVIFVRDNGVGFDMKCADKLFGAFQRLHRHEEFEGTGVGLATVRRILQRHGGRIWADAEEGKGATFYFTLSLKQESLTEMSIL
ncbi:MAG TPA: ATP-binding protein [Candidatus Sulfotelmatobacter sp.]|nr:ATP-binding protein [Candidatus Sulfotelmatobacter sp.]